MESRWRDTPTRWTHRVHAASAAEIWRDALEFLAKGDPWHVDPT